MTKAQLAKKIDELEDQYGWSSDAEQAILNIEISNLLVLWKAAA